MSNDEAIGNGEQMEERNTDKVWWIMKICVAGLLKVQYRNKNIIFMLQIFDKGNPLSARLLAPWMVDDMGLAHRRDGNNKWRTK